MKTLCEKEAGINNQQSLYNNNKKNHNDAQSILKQP